ncbi:MAG: hypothetical protein E7328_00165 [Clostridiales bacterium]|nr:hypothetical protein [Clostridiales bacterium]
MDPIIQSMITGYLSAFDAYEIKNDATKAQVEQWKQELTALANSTGDVGAFNTKFMESGLQERYMSLVTQVAMASMQQSAPAEQEASAVQPLPSVKQFLAQYEMGYQEVKKAGYRKRGEKAYEDLFAVADRTDDMLQAQIILEEERHLWKIVAEDSLDIYETIYEAMDPLYRMVTEPLKLHMDAYKESSGDEELTYKLEKLEDEKLRIRTEGGVQVQLAGQLAVFLLGYFKARIMVWEWESDKSASSGYAGMVSNRASIRRMLENMKALFGLTWQDLLKDESTKIWMLSPRNVDAFGRIKAAMVPGNFEVYADLLENEILTDKTMEEIIFRKPPKYMSFVLNAGHDRYAERAEKIAEELNKDIAYFKYMSQLSDVADAYAPKKQPEKKKENGLGGMFGQEAPKAAPAQQKGAESGKGGGWLKRMKLR